MAGLPPPFVRGEHAKGIDLRAYRDRVRSQVDAAAALDAVPAPAPGWTNLVLTPADLFVPALTYVFGLSHLGGHRGVLSWARLKPSAEEAALGVTLLRRLTVVMAHELGHGAGLAHCSLASCPMSRSLWVEAVDLKGSEFCADCAAALRSGRIEP